MWRHALDRRRLVGDEGRIAGEERIDQHGLAAEIEPERRMAEPGDLHDVLVLLWIGAQHSQGILRINRAC